MGLFGALAGAIGGKSKGGQSDTSKPFHTHASKSNNQNAGAAPAPVENLKLMNLGLMAVASSNLFLWVRNKLKSFQTLQIH